MFASVPVAAPRSGRHDIPVSASAKTALGFTRQNQMDRQEHLVILAMSGSSYLITGGVSFIGSALVRTLVRQGTGTVVKVDKRTHASNLASLAEVAGHPRYIFEQIDVCNARAIQFAFKRHLPTAVVHLAADCYVEAARV